jgi:hypothetical protein
MTVSDIEILRSLCSKVRQSVPLRFVPLNSAQVEVVVSVDAGFETNRDDSSQIGIIKWFHDP